MGRSAAGWAWTKVSRIHSGDTGCDGEIRSYAYRHYPPGDRFYERCIGLAWCSACREFSGTMVHVPRDRAFPDPLTGLPEFERERLLNSERKLLDYLDRLLRGDGRRFR